MLVAEHLEFRYGSVLAVDDVSLQVRPGELLGLLGPNGAGKSTTLSMLSGRLEPYRGHVSVNGHAFANSGAARAGLGLVPQDIAVYPDLTVEENVRFFGRLYGVTGADLRSRVEQVISGVELSSHARSPAGTLSGGMQRRLNLAVALTHRPRVVLLDEPTVGIDPQSRLRILEYIRGLADEGVAVLVASHQIHEIESLCDRVAVMDHGRLLVCDHVARLLERSASDATVVIDGALHADDPLLAIADVSLERVESNRTWLRLVAEDDRTLAERMAALFSALDEAGHGVLQVRKDERDLEHFFLELTGRALRD